MLAAAIVMTAIPDVIVRVMTDDPEVIRQAVVLLRIAAVFQIVDGIQAVGAGALRGAGMTNIAFIANLVGHWAVGLPLAVVLTFVLHMGPAGLWWGLTSGIAVVAAWLGLAFFKASAKPIAALKRVTMH
jgi:MATE family multidrug resistance protein